MPNQPYNFFPKLSRRTKAFVCLLLALAIGFLDHITGYEMAFSIFYLAPISFASWFLGLTHGQMMAIFLALTWLAVDYTSGTMYRVKAPSKNEILYELTDPSSPEGTDALVGEPERANQE